MNKKLSIITVVYNGEESLKHTIESIIDQTAFSVIEYIIIDGNSSDRTMSIVNNYRDKLTKVVSEPDHGVYDAMNKGLRYSTGDYILYINCGDTLSEHNIIERIAPHMNGQSHVIYGETNIIDNTRRVIGTRTQLTSRKLPGNLQKKDFLKGQVVSHQSFIAKKSLCQEYNLKYTCSSDIDWMLNILENSTTIINAGLSISNYLQGGISDRHLWQCWKERFFILLKHFNWAAVLFTHLIFVARFFIYGQYKLKPTKK